MTTARRWTLRALAVLALLLLAIVGFVAWWLPGEAELIRRLETEFEQRSGIALKVDGLHWALRPVPVIVLEGVATAQPTPITVRRLAVRPQLSALWRRRIAIDDVEIEGLVLPRDAVRAFRGRGKDAMAPTTSVSGWSLADRPLAQLRFSDLTWIDRRGIALAYAGSVEFDDGWRPRHADIRRENTEPVARLQLEREGDADRWRTLIDVGGGTWNGTSTLTQDGKNFAVHAELKAEGVDIAQLVSAFGRKSAVEGKIDGPSEVDAKGDDASALVRSLHTTTRFSVKPATILRFDLAKAVSTAGLKRDGQTKLDELTGTLETQATDDGMQLRYTGLRARSGLLTATGNARVLNRKLEGDAAVDLVDGVVGVPLKLGGTLDKPELSLTGAALAGAAVGTSVLPGIGTAIGARIGQKIDELFGDSPPKKKK